MYDLMVENAPSEEWRGEENYLIIENKDKFLSNCSHWLSDEVSEGRAGRLLIDNFESPGYFPVHIW